MPPESWQSGFGAFIILCISVVVARADSAKPNIVFIIAGPRWRAVSLRMGDWKLVVSEKNRNELFHIAKDPSEESNLANKEPERLKAMAAALKEARTKDNDSVVK